MTQSQGSLMKGMNIAEIFKISMLDIKNMNRVIKLILLALAEGKIFC
jgi:hypothetical protein